MASDFRATFEIPTSSMSNGVITAALPLLGKRGEYKGVIVFRSGQLVPTKC